MTSMQAHYDDALSVLDDAVSEHDDIAFLWTGGSDAQVVADLLLEKLGADVTFCTIDTGNQFEEMYEFRSEYHDQYNFDWNTYRYDEMIEQVIENSADPRGYHGGWNSEATVPDDDPIDSLPRSADEWDVASSCGTLKVVPMRDIIHEYDVLITGQRSADPFADLDDGFGHEQEKRDPIPHTRINPLAEWGEKQVWAYIKREFVPYCDLYDNGYRHTDSVCCTDDDAVGEHGEGGRDPAKLEQQEDLQDMGYV